MKSCEDIQRLICEYVDGALDRDNMNFVDEHIKGCTSCQNELIFQKMIKEAALDIVEEPCSEISDMVIAKINSSKKRRKVIYRIPSFAATAAAACLIIVVAASVLRDGTLEFFSNKNVGNEKLSENIDDSMENVECISETCDLSFDSYSEVSDINPNLAAYSSTSMSKRQTNILSTAEKDSSRLAHSSAASFADKKSDERSAAGKPSVNKAEIIYAENKSKVISDSNAKNLIGLIGSFNVKAVQKEKPVNDCEKIVLYYNDNLIVTIFIKDNYIFDPDNAILTAGNAVKLTDPELESIYMYFE